MRIAIIVQARMASTRLPGKILKTVLGKPLLAYQVERLRRVQQADSLVIATTVEPQDDAIVSLCDKLKVNAFRGSEEDVLSRYYEAAREEKADAVVRVTSDCPLIDPALIDTVISAFKKSDNKPDYVANTLQRTYPRGCDCEIFSFAVLEQADREATERPDREHVTRFFYRHPERFRLENVAYTKDYSQHRWTVDTPEDFELIRHMLEALYPIKPEFTLQDCLDLMAQHPDWAEINRAVVQKRDGS